MAIALRSLDPDGSRFARVLRDTLDQLYDGQRTGRFRWDQLFKTEKTHCGTLVEINLQREFEFDDGAKLDYQIAGIDVDCKYSQAVFSWTIPPEAVDHICLLVWADDQKSIWSAGLLRITGERLNAGRNRDGKGVINLAARQEIEWLFRNAPLPPNVLLHLPPETLELIFRHSGKRDGAKRVRELFRHVQKQRIGRGAVATVARQLDPVKRVRADGGARSALQPEGIVILGQWRSHQQVARDLGLPIPEYGEYVSARIVPAVPPFDSTAEIMGVRYRLAAETDPIVPAPVLPGR